MSYVSGFMVGAAIGKNIRYILGGQPKKCRRGCTRSAQGGKAEKPQLAEGFVLVSALPGRRRYRTSGMSQELAELLEEKLGQIDFLLDLEVNALTGSILFTYEGYDEGKMDALAAWLAAHVFCQSKPVTYGVPCPAHPRKGMLPTEDHAGSITRSIRHTARDFSGWIKRSTGGYFDLSSMLSLIFMLRGMRKMMLTHQYPSGVQMLWWALTLMRGWRTV